MIGVVIKNIIEYEQILNNIDNMLHDIDADYVCIRGDFNTDISRDTFQTKLLLKYAGENFYICTQDVSCQFSFTFCSKGNDRKSLTDHIVISNNMVDALQEYICLDSVDNFSDHVAIKGVFDFQVLEIFDDNEAVNQSNGNYANWKLASKEKLVLYEAKLTDELKKIEVPMHAIDCRGQDCHKHVIEINEFHNRIVDTCISTAVDVLANIGLNVK